ncbi:STAS/SEC14 domain-containing protein [Aureisphaera galaxeae]|uniref:STAS/SEC14 domain-containing protein n=1 Tax=Aureisphaera galaxeae TaxID=1538023 RepID=UPI002350EDF9|nr:STAS/SEC14 domain-containing protein [Aureisphaera galaxeae]MDC8003089.1 STAS/SEC14 domain-containing protein [Aureisphaera galaxeae]
MFLNFDLGDDVVGYIVDGVMDAASIEYLRDEILKRLERHETISVYLEDGGVKRFSLKSMVITTLFPHRHRGRIRKAAMVTDRSWIHFICWLNNFLVSTKIKNFKIKDRLKAMDWIAEEL